MLVKKYIRTWEYITKVKKYRKNLEKIGILCERAWQQKMKIILFQTGFQTWTKYLSRQKHKCRIVELGHFMKDIQNKRLLRSTLRQFHKCIDAENIFVVANLPHENDFEVI